MPGSKSGNTGTATLRELAKQLTGAIDQAARAEGVTAVEAAAGEGSASPEGAVRDKPLVAVSLAAAAGFLLAMQVRR